MTATRTPALARAMIAAALVALALAACGGSSGTSPATYVKSICTSLVGWKDAVQSAGTKLQGSGAATASPAGAKRDYLAFVSALEHATQQTAGGLRTAGTPAVSDGKKVSGRLVDAFSRAAGGLGTAYAKALAIPTTSASAFDGAASSVTAEIKSSLQGIATISPESSAQLRAAANADPTCQSLKG